MEVLVLYQVEPMEKHFGYVPLFSDGTCVEKLNNRVSETPESVDEDSIDRVNFPISHQPPCREPHPSPSRDAGQERFRRLGFEGAGSGWKVESAFNNHESGTPCEKEVDPKQERAQILWCGGRSHRNTLSWLSLLRTAERRVWAILGSNQ